MTIPAPSIKLFFRTLLVATLPVVACLPGAGSALAQDTVRSACDTSAPSTDGSCPEERLQVEVIRPGQRLDWVLTEDLPEALRDRACKVCGGRYIDPQAGAAAGGPALADIEATARRSELEGETVRLEGGVEVTQGFRELSGDSANYNRTTEIGQVEGNIVLREPGILLRGSRGEFFSRTGEAQIEGGEFVLHGQHLHGSADLISRDAQQLIRVENAELTYCAPGNTDWLLRSDQLELNLEKGEGIARGATLSAAGIPFLYTPWISFPLDERRRTGFLFPTVGNDSRGGAEISVPVYFNLAPNYDAQYTPRLIQQRGLNHELQARYLDPLNGAWLAGGSYLAGDEQYATDVPEAGSNDRWLTRAKHDGLYNKRWRSRIDYTRVSDIDFIRDLETSNLETRRDVNLLQLASVDYLGDEWLANLEVQKFQPLAEDIQENYRKLPQLTLQRRGSREPFRFDPVLLTQYSYFDSNKERVTGQRLYTEAGVAYPMLWEYGFLRTTAKYRHLQYWLDNTLAGEDDSPNASSALASLDGGLYFERSMRFAGNDLVQTLEPRLFYLYSAYDDQRELPDFDSAELTFNYNQLFRSTRFSGRDRLDDANQLAIGVTTRFLDPRDGTERMNASFGQIVYFENRRVRLNAAAPELERSNSEMAGELNFFPNERLRVTGSVQWDPETDKVNAGNLQARYERRNGRLFNLGYTYRRADALVGNQQPTDQVHASTYYPLTDNWSVFAAWNYSLEAERSVEDMVGFEYDSCCWQVRLLALRYFDTARGLFPDFTQPNLDRQRAIEVQFVLKGLGGVGSQVTQLMTNMIRGFRERDY